MQVIRVKENISSLKIVYSGLFIAMGIILPQAFHIFGQNAGMIFLPIQISILVAGLVMGHFYGGIVGFLVPVLSSLLMGMPPVPKVYFMIFELMAYGVITGIMIKNHSVYASLLTAMIGGRIVYGTALFMGVVLFGIRAPFANITAFWGGIITGIPGILIQFVIIPVLVKAIKKGGFFDE